MLVVSRNLKRNVSGSTFYHWKPRSSLRRRWIATSASPMILLRRSINLSALSISPHSRDRRAVNRFPCGVIISSNTVRMSESGDACGRARTRQRGTKEQ